MAFGSVAFALSWMCAAVQGAAFSLPDLMQQLAKHKVAKATFTEKKFIGFVDQPLESSGELSYVAPDRLEKRTLHPRPEALILDGERLVIEQPGRRRMSVNVASRPEAAAFIESIRGTLAGDLSALQKYYTLDLSGQADAWRLVLVPTQPDMLKIVTRIRIEGTRDALTFIAFDQADGDHSEMRIVASNPSP